MMDKKQADRAATRIKTAYFWAAKKAEAVESAIHDEDISWEEFDRLLEAEEHALDKLAEAIHDGTLGAVSEGEADRLVRFRFDEVGELVARLTA